jgi:hypothetical protein
MRAVQKLLLLNPTATPNTPYCARYQKPELEDRPTLPSFPNNWITSESVKTLSSSSLSLYQPIATKLRS